MKEEGYVKNITDDKCEIVVRRKTACGDNCASCGGSCRMKFQTVTARNIANAAPGDNVEIEMDNKKVYLSAFLVYILPLAVFNTAYVLLYKFFSESAVSIVLSLVAAVIFLIPAIIYDRTKKEDFLPNVTKILEKHKEM